MKKIAIILLGLLSTPVITANAHVEKARATLVGADGRVVGNAFLTETSEGVHIRLRLDDVPAGSHALYIHEVGACSSDFSAAGGHPLPEVGRNGLHHGTGHAEVLKLELDERDGTLIAERMATGVTLVADAENSLFDADGSAVMLRTSPDEHAGQTSHASPPSGGAGGWVLCGVVERGALSR